MKDFNEIKERKEALLKSKGSLLGSVLNEPHIMSKPLMPNNNSSYNKSNNDMIYD